ncbi:MAG TPA: nuclear transport factor 2 family protein [Vicinamibacterales bacterium]|nr:nuclear transport factor 2 family protein [Vicinamibacterales bacterium]
MKHRLVIVAAAALSFVIASAQTIPQTIADELLAADRAFAAAAKQKDIIPALSAMFAPDVIATIGPSVVTGTAKVIEALKANPLNTGGRIEWTPARVGLSGDGTHGFTAGFMTVHRPDGSTQPLKYLAYWAKQKDGWRVLVYKRSVAKQPAPAMPVSYVIPKQMAPASANIDRDRESLAAAERAFSRDAQTMGLTAAFKKYGDPEAINLGGPGVPGFLIGNEQIGEGVGSGTPTNSSPLHWGPDQTIIAGSGDFGITIGYLVQNQPGPDGKPQPRIPFFTIWKRESTKAGWKYIAE